MKHLVLIVISLISSIFFNSKYTTDVNTYFKQTLKLENEPAYALTFILYTVIIYLFSYVVNYITIHKHDKNLKNLQDKNEKLEGKIKELEGTIKKLEDTIKELRKILTQHSVKSYSIIELLNIKSNNIQVIDDFISYMNNFINNHNKYIDIDVEAIFTQSKSSMDTIKKSNNVNKL